MRIEVNDDMVLACLSGEIDHHTAKQIRSEIDATVENAKPATLVLDFSEVVFMDSSGIGLVMGRVKIMQGYSGKVRVQNTSQGIKKVMRLAGLDRLAEIV